MKLMLTVVNNCKNGSEQSVVVAALVGCRGGALLLRHLTCACDMGPTIEIPKLLLRFLVIL